MKGLQKDGDCFSVRDSGGVCLNTADDYQHYDDKKGSTAEPGADDAEWGPDGDRANCRFRVVVVVDHVLNFLAEVVFTELLGDVGHEISGDYSGFLRLEHIHGRLAHEGVGEGVSNEAASGPIFDID